MVRIIPSNVVRLPGGILEKCRDFLEELFLVALGCEVVMCLSLLDDVCSQAALGEQGIGSDGLACDVQGVEEGDGDSDFVGLLYLVAAFHRQSADFFWV